MPEPEAPASLAGLLAGDVLAWGLAADGALTLVLVSGPKLRFSPAQAQAARERLEEISGPAAGPAPALKGARRRRKAGPKRKDHSAA